MAGTIEAKGPQGLAEIQADLAKQHVEAAAQNHHAGGVSPGESDFAQLLGMDVRHLNNVPGVTTAASAPTAGAESEGRVIIVNLNQ